MIVWIHETTLTTTSEAAKCQKKSRAAGFSEDGVSENFNLFERTIEDNYILLYVYNIYGSALMIYKEKTGQVITEKCNISYVVNLKCEERSSSSNSSSSNSISSSSSSNSSSSSTSNVCCHRFDCCAPPMVYTKLQEYVKA